MDDAEFGELYAAMRGQVYSFAARRLGSERAKDAVSATFETAWEKRHEFPANKDHWRAWLVGIAKNKVLQEAQRVARKHHDNRFITDWDPAGHPEAWSEDAAHLVSEWDGGMRVYVKLTPSERLLFDVAFVRDLRASEAARVLGISPSAFKTRLSRLRSRLRALHEIESTSGEGQERGGVT